MAEACSETNSAPALDKSQEDFIKNCDAEFAHRYTEDDIDYKNLKETGFQNPPIVDPWFTKPKRNFNWDNKNRPDFRRNSNNGDRRDNYQGNKYKNQHNNNYRHRPY